MLAGVIGGKPSAGRPRLAAVSWKSEINWSRLPVVGRGEGGTGVVFLMGLSSRWRWEAMLEDVIGDAKPKQ